MEEAVGIVAEFINGSFSPEESLCMLISLLGEEQTKREFDTIISKAGIRQGSLLHKQLDDVYSQYFGVFDANVSHAPDIRASFGDELDLELALALSVTDKVTLSGSQTLSTTGTPVTDTNQSYASRTKSSLSNVNSKTRLGSSPSVSPLFANDLSSADSVFSQQKNVWPVRQPEEPTSIAQSPPFNNDQAAKRKKKKKKAQHVPGIMHHISKKPVIYWLRRDFRHHDNPALVAAYESNAPVILAFLWNEMEEGPLAAGGATKYWLHFALKELNTSFQQIYNNQIVFRKVNNSFAEMKSLVSEVGAGAVIMNNLYEPCLKARDDTISAYLESQGVEMKQFHSYLLHEPGSVNTESMGMRGIGSITHFMECCHQSSTHPIGLPAEKPPCVPASANMPHSQTLDELGLSRLPRRRDGTIIDWAKGIRESWDFSENGAWNALGLFVEEGIRQYEKESGRADMLNTSRISPYLHFGQVSPRAVLRHAQGLRSPKFLRKLSWRDLSYWLLTLFPDMPNKPMRPHYRSQRWSQNKTHLRAWQKGKTGYPLVDAAMRQLWITGWMNNYARHVVASFLISYLHLHWEHGYAWFQDTLLDADVAINAMMWQNGGMSGLDQWNFVMHPVDAALTCDPKGQYVRQWCPELAAIPDDYIHKPWKCPPSVLRRAGVELGKTYPQRIITNLEEAREQSLRDVVDLRLSNRQFVDHYTGNDLVPLPSGLLLPVITRKEFKYKTAHPQAKDNPHTAVLRGYRSRKRDEAIAFTNKVDFTASTLNEIALRQKRYEQANKLIQF